MVMWRRSMPRVARGRLLFPVLVSVCVGSRSYMCGGSGRGGRRCEAGPQGECAGPRRASRSTVFASTNVEVWGVDRSLDGFTRNGVAWIVRCRLSCALHESRVPISCGDAALRCPWRFSVHVREMYLQDFILTLNTARTAHCNVETRG